MQEQIFSGKTSVKRFLRLKKAETSRDEYEAARAKKNFYYVSTTLSSDVQSYHEIAVHLCPSSQ